MLNRPIAARHSLRQRRARLGHMCPQCRHPWALTADRNDVGFLVVCRYCGYERPVVLPRPRPVPAVENALG